MSDKQLSIRVRIANKSYPLTIDFEEEARVRESASDINAMMIQYREKYSVASDRDLLAMVALHFAVKHAQLTAEHNDNSHWDQLQIIQDELGAFLTKMEK